MVTPKPLANRARAPAPRSTNQSAAVIARPTPTLAPQHSRAQACPKPAPVQALGDDASSGRRRILTAQLGFGRGTAATLAAARTALGLAPRGLVFRPSQRIGQGPSRRAISGRVVLCAGVAVAAQAVAAG